jgi:copper(I)-binding protein
LLKLIVASLVLAACSQPAAEKPLEFENAWVRPMPPGSMMTAGFGRLVNYSDADIEINAYSSPQFEDVSLHQTVLEGGLSRMNKVPVLNLAAGSEMELAPGGYHLMFMKQIGEQTESVQINFELADGRRFTFELPVERR